MPIGFIRRLARQSYRTTYVSGSNSFPSLQDNWTTQRTTTYNASLPADSPSAWGGTLANLDRVFTATGGAYAALGMLITFVQKPEGNSLGQNGSLAGAIIKVQPTFISTSSPAIEVWSKQGSTWTKRRRVALAGTVRSGDTLILDLTGPVLETPAVDAYWITMAPDDVGDSLSWLACHVYGICLNDPVTPDCPPATPPDECNGIECSTDPDDWTCLEPPEETNPIPDPFTLPPITVAVPNPTSYTQAPSGKFFHNCPRPTRLIFYFGELPGGGSVTVTVANPAGCTFVEGASQTISTPGEMTWTVATGFIAANSGADPAFPPAAVDPETTWLFTRELDATVWETAGNLLDILMYFWTYDFGYVEVC